MPAMIQYSYGAGWVLATSLYPDFSAINGLQTADDVGFMRSFYLQAWADARNLKLGQVLQPQDAATLTIPVRNTTAADLTTVPVQLDFMPIGGAESWRYGVHYLSWQSFNYEQSVSQQVPLIPPLGPGQERSVAVAITAPQTVGLHSVVVNHVPQELLLITQPGFGLATHIDVHTDKVGYLTDDVALITATLSLSPFSSPEQVNLTASIPALPPQQLLLTPGVPVTVTYALSLTEELLGKPISLILARAADGQRLAQVQLPLRVTLRPSPIVLEPTANTQLLWVGAPLSVTVALSATSALANPMFFEMRTNLPSVAIPPQFLAPGERRQLVVAFPAKSTLITTPLEITAVEQPRNKPRTATIPLRIIPVPPAQLQLETVGATSTQVDLLLRNQGGHGTPFTGTIEIAGIASRSISGMFGAANISTHAPPPPQAVTLPLAGIQAAGSYVLRWTLDGPNNQHWSGNSVVTLPGQRATLSSTTEHTTYAAADTVTTTHRITATQPLTNSWLHLMVTRAGASGDAVSTVGGQAPGSDGVGPAARISELGDIALSTDGTFALFPDTRMGTIRRIEIASGAVTTVAGIPINGRGFRDGRGQDAQLDDPRSIALSL